jgi:hypothetical protein
MEYSNDWRYYLYFQDNFNYRAGTVPYEVLIGASADASFANLVLAINGVQVLVLTIVPVQ